MESKLEDIKALSFDISLLEATSKNLFVTGEHLEYCEARIDSLWIKKALLKQELIESILKM